MRLSNKPTRKCNYSNTVSGARRDVNTRGADDNFGSKMEKATAGWKEVSLFVLFTRYSSFAEPSRRRRGGRGVLYSTHFVYQWEVMQLRQCTKCDINGTSSHLLHCPNNRKISGHKQKVQNMLYSTLQLLP